MTTDSQSIINIEKASSVAETVSDPAVVPTVYHVTHWKAGSQWIRSILENACSDRIVKLKEDMSHVTAEPHVQGGVYTPIYIEYNRFITTVNQKMPYRVFFVMRDLRDTLISWYFSMKISHGVTEGTRVGEFRKILNEMDFEEGLEYVLCNRLPGMENMQRGWINSGELVIRYEDLIADQHAVFKQIHNYCQLDISPEAWNRLVAENAFEKISGRKQGEEDVTKHHRKGISGDWKNHFSPRIKALFKERYGQILIEAGYEKNADW